MFRVNKKCIKWKYISALNRLVIAPYEKTKKNVSHLKNKMKNKKYHTVETIPKNTTRSEQFQKSNTKIVRKRGLTSYVSQPLSGMMRSW